MQEQRSRSVFLAVLLAFSNSWCQLAQKNAPMPDRACASWDGLKHNEGTVYYNICWYQPGRKCLNKERAFHYRYPFLTDVLPSMRNAHANTDWNEYAGSGSQYVSTFDTHT